MQPWGVQPALYKDIGCIDSYFYFLLFLYPSITTNIECLNLTLRPRCWPVKNRLLVDPRPIAEDLVTKHLPITVQEGP